VAQTPQAENQVARLPSSQILKSAVATGSSIPPNMYLNSVERGIGEASALAD
jgi:hypothetical protein